MGVKKKSMKGKGAYAAYKAAGTREKNRNERLKRHLAKHPKDAQAKRAAGKPKSAKTPSRNKVGQPQKALILRDKAGHVILSPKYFSSYVEPKAEK
jgi:hypothetical protein